MREGNRGQTRATGSNFTMYNNCFYSTFKYLITLWSILKMFQITFKFTNLVTYNPYRAKLQHFNHYKNSKVPARPLSRQCLHIHVCEESESAI